MTQVGSLISFVLGIAIFILIARFVLDWVQMLARSWSPRGPILVLCEIIYSATDPPLRFVRRFIPPVRLGAMALDLSPMVLLIALYLLVIINNRVFF
ncbi:YggT family protein [Solicola sp. PLA-1-18]|uniref:YggT family protein n=1 Tax=Solicola sp. PLA-1-18 TaxID=3380532 RepID=UPI003B7970D0